MKRRFEEHNKGQSFATRCGRPWKLIYYEAYFSEKDVREREKKLKQHKQALGHLKKRIRYSIKESKGSPSTFKTFKKESGGFIALTTILIILAVSLIVGLSIGLLSINEAIMGLKKTQSSQADYLANLCAEEALMKLKEDINYPGNETIEIEEGNCQILPIEGNWTVKTIANFQNQIKKIKIVVSQINPQMLISSWQEVADF